jgi:hypothetical protein
MDNDELAREIAKKVAEELKRSGQGRSIAYEFIRVIKEEIGDSVIKKIFWLFVAVLIAAGVYLGVIEVKDLA